MSTRSTIEWTGHTWNAATGCDTVSPGCDNCYAKALAKRLKAMGNPRYQNDGEPPSSGPGFGVTLHWDKVEEPLGWKQPNFVFVNSMSDLFHAEIPDEFIKACFDTMVAADWLTFQVLTKRPKRLARLAVDLPWRENIWMGVSIENDDYVWRADYLRKVPAAVRFLSIEPMLAAVPSLNLDGIGWVITGGESGPGARALDLEWVRDVRDRCVADRIPFFHKQNGGRTPKAGGRELDGRSWDEMPSIGVTPRRATPSRGIAALAR